MDYKNLYDGAEAVFLPGKLHGNENEVYIMCFSDDSDCGKESFMIYAVRARDILEVCNTYKAARLHTEECAVAACDIICSISKGFYVDSGKALFESYKEVFGEADFILGRDGGYKEEAEFLVGWAKKQTERPEILRFENNVRPLTEMYLRNGYSLTVKEVLDTISISICKDGLLHQDIASIIPEYAKGNENITVLIWTDPATMDYTHRLSIPVYGEEGGN